MRRIFSSLAVCLTAFSLLSIAPVPSVAVTLGVARHVPAGSGTDDSDKGVLAGPYLQDATPQSIWICWENEAGPGAQGAHVRFGTDSHLGNQAQAQSQLSSAGSILHKAQLTGLIPNHAYYYQVVTDHWAGRVRRFRTAQKDLAETPWRFVAIADTQLDLPGSMQHRETVEKGIRDFVYQNLGPELSDELAFVINAGDLVCDGAEHGDWVDHFFGQGKALLTEVPLYPVLGNHEEDHPFYFQYFQLPRNGTPTFEEHWYYKDHQNVRLIGLDSNGPYDGQAQLDWLDGVLLEAAGMEHIDFVFVQFHHPVKTEFWLPRPNPYGEQILERFEQFSTATGKPSMHMVGHYHGYSRGQSRDHKHVWLDVASAMGRPAYWDGLTQTDYPEIEISVPEWGFVLIDVEAGADPSFRIRRYSRGNRSVNRDNELIDELTVRRYNTPPDQPLALLPAPTSDPLPGHDVELFASPFFDADGDTLLESHWQVTTVSGDYADPLVDDWRRFQNWFAPSNGDDWYSVNTVIDKDIENIHLVDSLPGCKTAFWRVRYRDSSLEWSAWSAEQSFPVGNSDYGDLEPSPRNGLIGSERAPTLTWDFCTPVDSFDVYLGTSASLGAGEYLDSVVVTEFSPGMLEPETQYFWRVDFVKAGVVTTGNLWAFTTVPEFPSVHTTEWRMDDAAPATGIPLEAALGTSELTPSGMTLGAEWSLGVTGPPVPDILGSQASFIELTNAYGSQAGLRTAFQVPSNGGAPVYAVYKFTFIWDLYIDPRETGLQPLWQDEFTNSNAAELYLNCDTEGFEIGGHSSVGLWNKGEWVRIVHRVDWAEGTSAIFVNGTKVLSDSELVAPGWVFAGFTGLPFWMLTDLSGDPLGSQVHCANLAVVGSLMPDIDIAALGGPDADGIFVETVNNFCFAGPNSLGKQVSISHSGSTSLSRNDLTLHASSAVPNSFGLFYYAQESTQYPFGDSAGCLGGGSSGRIFLLPGQATNALGNASLRMDWNGNQAVPPISPGAVGYFQFWSRDTGTDPGGFQTSDGLRVEFKH